MDATKPVLTITYCTQCNWLLRSAWMAQEVLSTFSLEMGEVILRELEVSICGRRLPVSI